MVAREALESVPEALRASRPVGSVMARDDGESGLRIGLEEPLESLLGQEGLARLGAIMAVDRDGVLRGGHDRLGAARTARQQAEARGARRYIESRPPHECPSTTSSS